MTTGSKKQGRKEYLNSEIQGYRHILDTKSNVCLKSADSVSNEMFPGKKPIQQQPGLSNNSIFR